MNELDAQRARKTLESARPLPRTFYARDPVTVARHLLGVLLIREREAGRTAGRIVETEAYLAAGDPASHSYAGRKNRNASMFGPPGHAYVYAIHSRWCFNAVTEPVDVASAVLIRAVKPLIGLDLMCARRGVEKLRDLCRGPARLCEAFAIDRELDGWDLTAGDTLWLAAVPDMPRPGEIATSPRVGVTSAHDRPLRFFYVQNPYVSGPRRR